VLISALQTWVPRMERPRGAHSRAGWRQLGREVQQVSGLRPMLCASECYGTGDGSRSSAYSVSVIATLNDPLTVFVAHNFPHVMAPHDDGTDRGAARV
jgi:hypothetical protein